MSLNSRIAQLRDQVASNARPGDQIEGELHAIIFQAGNSECGSCVRDALDYAEACYHEDRWKRYGGREQALGFLLDALSRAEKSLQPPAEA